jgi:hypothetical protein
MCFLRSHASMHYLFSVCNNLRASNTFCKTAAHCVEWSYNLLAHTINPHVLACGGVPLASRVVIRHETINDQCVLFVEV